MAIPDVARDTVVTEWAIALEYTDGEVRYRAADDEAEAREEADLAQMHAMYRDPSDSYPIAAWAVSRQVRVTPWQQPDDQEM